LVASRLLAVLYMHVSLWYVRITYCRGQACRRPVTYNFPTLAAIKLRVLVDSKGGAASLVSVGAAVRDPQRFATLVLVVAELATVEALHGILRLLGRLWIRVTFSVALALAAKLAARLATSLARFAFLAPFALTGIRLLLLVGSLMLVAPLATPTAALASALGASPAPLLPLPAIGI
jgi:hypothetical protein